MITKPFSSIIISPFGSAYFRSLTIDYSDDRGKAAIVFLVKSYETSYNVRR